MKIGLKIKERRMILGLTQEELANRCELTKGYISQLENDKTDPSIATLEIILNVLGIKLDEFFKDYEEEKITFRESEQLDTEFNGYTQSWLIPSALSKKIESIFIVLKPGKKTILDYPHEGEEFGYIITGEVQIHYGNHIEKCSTGESFYFKSDKIHFIENIGNKDAHIIWVSSPPNF